MDRGGGQGNLKAVTIFCTMLMDPSHYTLVKTHRCTLWVSPMGNNKLCMVMMNQCRFLSSEKSTVEDVGN